MSLPEKISSVDIKIGTLSVLDNGYLLYEFRDDVHIDKEDIIRMIDAHTQLADGTPRYVLVITGARMSVSPEARKYDNRDIRLTITKAEALVVTNLPTRIGTNFYYSMMKPPYPMKSFGNEEKAFNWLQKLEASTI